MADVLVSAAHPHVESSHVNRALLQAARALGERHVEVRDLYALYPDYAIDIEAEQAALARARLVIWQHPIHWYSMPSLMKLWVDDVLAFGWAYGPGGTALKEREACGLSRRPARPEDSYRPTATTLLLRCLPAALRTDGDAVRECASAAIRAARCAPRRRR